VTPAPLTPKRRNLGRLLTAAVSALAGLLIMAGASNARGIDLRPGRNTDLVSLVQQQSRRNVDLNRGVTGLREEVDRLSVPAEPSGTAPELDRQAAYAGLGPVSGPAVTVTLTDAPASVAAAELDPDLLVVHQQDIQAVVNALWSGGAEAMTVQGVRVISTTGIKCVGNTVVLHGIPYAPPYVISAIGDPQRLEDALSSSESVKIYRQYVAAYGLGYAEKSTARTELTGYEGSVDLAQARVWSGER
jgi:uncharacterized protein YlxW (UPF0749 family)